MTTLADRANKIPLPGLTKPKHDPRPADQFIADLEAETARSLELDPTRWKWIHTGMISRPPAW